MSKVRCVQCGELGHPMCAGDAHQQAFQKSAVKMRKRQKAQRKSYDKHEQWSSERNNATDVSNALVGRRGVDRTVGERPSNKQKGRKQSSRAPEESDASETDCWINVKGETPAKGKRNADAWMQHQGWNDGCSLGWQDTNGWGGKSSRQTWG